MVNEQLIYGDTHNLEKNIISKYRVYSWSAPLSQLQSHQSEIAYVNSKEQNMVWEEKIVVVVNKWQAPKLIRMIA
jgi:hypothetical protein